MLTLPIPLLINFLVGLLSVAVLLSGLALVYRGWRKYRATRMVPVAVRRAGQVPVAIDVEPARLRDPLADPSVWVPLASGLALLLLTFGGRHLVALGYPSGADEPHELHSSTVRYLPRPDGTKIRAEIFGASDAPTLVLTHGWGTSNTEWYYAKRQLAGQFRLIVWDLPGLGQSSQPDNRDYSLDKMASDLESVLSLADGKPVVLVGHSIGGMINLTFCRRFPDQLGKQVAGIAQFDTSYTNPVTTTKDAPLARAIQKPIGEPLLHVMIWFSPLVRVMNWLSYQNGAAHMMNAQSAFAGAETWGQLDLVSSYGYRSSPAVVARGTLAMFHWDAKPVLPQVTVPVLIVVGREDTTTLPSASEYMRSAMPRAALEEISPAAHYGLLEQNQRFDSLLASFAAGCLKPGAAK